jgi:hypothetical protein
MSRGPDGPLAATRRRRPGWLRVLDLAAAVAVALLLRPGR